MFELTDTETLLEVFRSCLKDGVADKGDINLRTTDRSLILIISPSDRYMAIYNYGVLLLKMDYLAGNIEWDEVEKGTDVKENQTSIYLSSAVFTIYKEELERRGYHVIREKQSRYLN